jgi:hypothetical protein
VVNSFLKQIFRATYLLSRAARMLVREPTSALLIIRMAGWVIVLSVMLRFVSIPRALGIVQPRRIRAKRPVDEVPVQRRLAGLLDSLLSTDVLTFTPTCWKRAAILYRFLALNGIESRVLFGVKVEHGGELKGHAWLEAEGKPILEHGIPDYTVTYSFP